MTNACWISEATNLLLVASNLIGVFIYLASNIDWFSRCRWNPIFGSPIVGMKCDQSNLWLIDAEQKAPTHTKAYDIGSGSSLKRFRGS